MTKISYAGYRFPPVIIQQAVWLYARFTLSFRDVEDQLAERGINSCGAARCWSSLKRYWRALIGMEACVATGCG
jgi:transposase-like protein